VSYQFGPGPLTPGVRAIIYTNVALFAVTLVSSTWLISWLGLAPEQVVTRGFAWQLFTYQFLHQDALHILFNMLFVWMFGVDLERRWGLHAFLKYYLIVGTTAGVCATIASLLPLASAEASYYSVTIGASGAVYGLMMAWAIIFPHRTILFFGIVPMPARVFVLITGAISLSYAMGAGGGSNVSHLAHLGGLVAGWLYLKQPVKRPPPPRPRPDYLRRVH
jgi:membrane associated rhomboid family serine protease